MKVKDLKALLNGVDDNTEVVISDVTDRLIRITGGGEMCGDALVIRCDQEFPDAWFDPMSGREFCYVDGVRVSLVDDNEETEILIHNPSLLGVDKEIAFQMRFFDGWAEGDGVHMDYPQLAELTNSEIENINEYLGGRITDSRVLTPYDVAMYFGVLKVDGIMTDTNGHNPELVKKINTLWATKRDKFRPVLVALYDRDLKEIMDSDAFVGLPDDNDGAFVELQTRWDLHAANYLQHIADDGDLECIISFVR